MSAPPRRAVPRGAPGAVRKKRRPSACADTRRPSTRSATSAVTGDPPVVISRSSGCSSSPPMFHTITLPLA